jgi:hypothetical protein
MRSAGKPAVVEKGLLLQRRGAAQDRVAMREASEAANDIGMLLGVFAELIIAASRLVGSMENKEHPRTVIGFGQLQNTLISDRIA